MAPRYVRRTVAACGQGAGRAGLRGDGYPVAALLGRDGGKSLCDAFFSLIDDIREGRYEPVMLAQPDGKPYDFSFMQIVQYGGAMQTERAASFSALLDTFYTRGSRPSGCGSGP